MNIERTTTREIEDVRSSLERLYQTIPRSRSIIAAVRAGEIEFQDFLAKAGLLDFGTSTSSVHPDHDIELHAFVLGIVSEDRWDEIQTKSFLTYASHWIDDFFDSPDRVADPEQLLRDRRDIRQALANMGPAGRCWVRDGRPRSASGGNLQNPASDAVRRTRAAIPRPC